MLPKSCFGKCWALACFSRSPDVPRHQQQRYQPGCKSSRTTSQHMPWLSTTPQPQPAPRDDSESFHTPLWLELCFKCEQSCQWLPGLYLICEQSSLFWPVAVQKALFGQCEDRKGRSPLHRSREVVALPWGSPTLQHLTPPCCGPVESCCRGASMCWAGGSYLQLPSHKALSAVRAAKALCHLRHYPAISKTSFYDGWR